MPSAPRRLRLLIPLALVLVAGCSLLSPSASPSPTDEGIPTPSPTARPTPTPEPTPTPSPTPVPLNSSLLYGRITVLFAGNDSTPDRVANGYGPLTDCMVVASVSADHKQLTMVALPRDATDIPLANGAIWHLKANAIRFSYDMPGLEGALEATYGIPIDYWVEISMPDLPKLVDALGGVWVDVPYEIHDAEVGLNIGAGPQRLDGVTALQYARARHFDSDYARAARQMQIIASLAQRIADLGAKFDPATILTLLTTLHTDVPLGDIPSLLKVVGAAADAQVTATVLTPPQFSLYSGIEPGTNRGWVMIANVPAMRRYVQSLMGGP